MKAHPGSARRDSRGAGGGPAAAVPVAVRVTPAPMRVAPTAAVAAVLAVALCLAGCTAAPERPAPPAARDWVAVALPPPAAGARQVVRALAHCAGIWFAAGALQDPSGTAPALWASPDAATWRAVPLRPRSPYGPEHTLYALGCRGPTLVALGAAPGGAHGYPRTSTWSGRSAGLVEEPGAYTLFGGADAVNVARVTAGPRGWLLTGNRVGGAAAWTSPDGLAFTPRGGGALAHDARRRVWAADGTAAPAGWVLAGATMDTPPAPAAWSSPDGGAWTALAVPTGATGGLDRVLSLPGGVIAVGGRGQGYASWRLDGRAVTPLGRFGGGRAPAVLAAVAADGGPHVLVGAGGHRQLWWSPDGGMSWAEMALPTEAAGACRTCAADLAAGAGGLLLATEDGGGTRLWRASDATATPSSDRSAEPSAGLSRR